MQIGQAATPAVAGPVNYAGASGNAAIGLLMQQIGSAQWNNYQVLRWTWWDYVSIPNTGALTTPWTFFSVPAGQADPVSGRQKTLEQTNMQQSGQFGQQYFVIQQLRLHLNALPKVRQNATVAALTTFSFDQLVFANKFASALLAGVMTVTIGQKLYFQNVQPLRVLPPGFGVDQVIVPFDLTTNAAGNAYIAQSNNLSDVYNLSPPQMIEPTQTFTAQMTFPDIGYEFHDAFDAAAQNANVECGFIRAGYILRPVQ